MDVCMSYSLFVCLDHVFDCQKRLEFLCLQKNDRKIMSPSMQQINWRQTCCHDLLSFKKHLFRWTLLKKIQVIMWNETSIAQFLTVTNWYNWDSIIVEEYVWCPKKHYTCSHNSMFRYLNFGFFQIITMHYFHISNIW